MKYIQILALIFISMYSYAQPGTLDNSFSADGIASFNFRGGDATGTSVHIQSDGKIVFCGTSADSDGFADSQDLYVARINPDGLLDNTFGDNGFARSFRNGLDRGIALDIQADGKTVVLGSGFYIARFTNNGSFDPDFGVGGQVSYSFGLPDTEGSDIAVQPDGKIIVVGKADESIAMVRLNTDGTVDNTFGVNGEVITSVVFYNNIKQIYIQDDGKIAATGYTSVSEAETSLLVRYNADGTLDNTLGANGTLLFNLLPDDDLPQGITVAPTGEIIVSGQAGHMGNQDVLVARFLPDGTLDNSFSVDGVVQTDFGDHEGGGKVLLQPDNKILVSGWTKVGGDRRMALFRYNWDGTLDNTFGINGRVATSSPLGGGGGFGSVALQEDGKIVACGVCEDEDYNESVCVARYLSGINIGIGEVDAYIGSTLIYPNPITNNSITVEYELKADETVSIELYDLAGKQISMLQSAIDEKANSYQKTLSLPTLSAGNYILKLNTEKGAVSVKMVKE